MREKRKDSPFFAYGFLLDRDVAKAASYFPRKRTKTLSDIGLPQHAADAESVRVAWERELTIVTGNGDDFIREIHKFLSQTKRSECHEMRGLVVLPNGYERQKRLLQGIERTMKLGTKKLTWADVADKDCYVRVKRTGGTEVRRFPRCVFCQRNEQK